MIYLVKGRIPTRHARLYISMVDAVYKCNVMVQQENSGGSKAHLVLYPICTLPDGD